MVMIRCFHSGFIASVWISRYHGLRSFDIASSNSNFEPVVATVVACNKRIGFVGIGRTLWTVPTYVVITYL